MNDRVCIIKYDLVLQNINTVAKAHVKESIYYLSYGNSATKKYH